VSIARASSITRPFSSPTTHRNLDPETSMGIMQLLYRINKTGTTVLMATHDREMVDRNAPPCDRARRGQSSPRPETRRLWGRLASSEGGLRVAQAQLLHDHRRYGDGLLSILVLGGVLLFVFTTDALLQEVEEKVEITVFLKTGPTLSPTRSPLCRTRSRAGTR